MRRAVLLCVIIALPALRDAGPLPSSGPSASGIGIADLFVCAAAAAAQAKPMTPAAARLDEPFTLAVGQWATLPTADNATITVVNLRGDTRCPKDMNCMRIGGVRVIVTVKSGGKLARFDLTTDPAERRTIGSFSGYLVELLSVTPYPEKSGVRIPLGDYRVTLRVRTGSLSGAPRLNEPFSVKLGRAIALDGSNVRVSFDAVEQDSRCPVDAVCATSGTAHVGITLERDGRTERLVLKADPDVAFMRSTTFTSHTVFLHSLTPYPQVQFASKEIQPAEYEATLVVAQFGR